MPYMPYQSLTYIEEWPTHDKKLWDTEDDNTRRAFIIE